VTPDIPPHCLTLADGQRVLVRPAVAADYPAISRLIQDNFANDEGYAQLSDAARAAYTAANSLAGITEACAHPDNVVSLVATRADTGAIVAFALYRRGKHLITGEEVAEGKRVQIARPMKARGLGNQLLGIVRQRLRDMGFRMPPNPLSDRPCGPSAATTTSAPSWPGWPTAKPIRRPSSAASAAGDPRTGDGALRRGNAQQRRNRRQVTRRGSGYCPRIQPHPTGLPQPAANTAGRPEPAHRRQWTGARESRSREPRNTTRKSPPLTNDVHALLSAAVALHRRGRLAEAAQGYRQILDSAPEHFDALHLLGVIQSQRGDCAAALPLLERAVALRPANADAWVNLGNALREAGRHRQALAAFARALRLNPAIPQAHYNRALTLQEQGDSRAALAGYEQALALAPQYRDALFNRGVALLALRRAADAAAAFDQALALDPDCPYAAGKRFYARLLACDWSNYAADREQLTAAVRAGRRVCDPFAFAGIADCPEAQLACARTHADDRYPPAPAPLWNGERYRHARIRIAYVSADFHDHPTSQLAAGLFERHDRDRFELTALALGPERTGAMRRRLVAAFDRFVPAAARSSTQLAELLRALEIDIAVDLMGYTQGGRPEIFALRPAPVQVAYLGQPATTGAPWMDYLIADAMVIPPQQRRYYTEQVVYLPDCYQVCDDRRALPTAQPARADAGLPETGFVFCCFNNHYKIAPEIFAIWMRLLRRTPASVLWLLVDDSAAVGNLRAAAAAQGVAPERLIPAPRLSHEGHLARQSLADLFLDTLPYNAHTTANEALWLGLPVLTCPGRGFASRVAASLLHALGIPELIAPDLAAYERTALELARDPERLRRLRARLAAARATSPLFDTDRFRRHLEDAFTRMWERSQRGLPPESFAVARRA